MIQKLPQTVGAFTPIVNAGASFSPAGSAANLYGVGFNSTLTLIDGFRQTLAPFPQNINGEGTVTWTQAAPIRPGTEFRILSTNPAQAYDPTKPFEGGQEGAYVKGITTNVSTNASGVTSGISGNSAIQPPATSVSQSISSNIHAVIVSGLSDPAKVIVSSKVTVTGGIVALGKNASTPTAWSPGLKIIPDYALLTGEKIPPVTPNIIDVRIVRQEVTADFPSSSSKPDN